MSDLQTPAQLAHDLALQYGDNTHVLAQRLSEWCGHGPVLEQDIALTNIALDLLGQTRLYLAYAAELEGQGRNEDDLAYLRDTPQYRNVLLVEQPNEDWAFTLTRQFFFDAYHHLHCQALCRSTDPRLAEIAEKALKEVTYHLRFSSEWMVRLGDGTDLSRQKMQQAVNDLWMFTGELTTPAPTEQAAAAIGLAPDLDQLRPLWQQKVHDVLTEATLTVPTNDWMQKGGKTGQHTEHLGFLLAEMQHLQRTYPGQQW
jgi:ring-1,2-phenylacetyl-CoA epoxidase subunit PaaC